MNFMDLKHHLGRRNPLDSQDETYRENLQLYISLKLAASGQPVGHDVSNADFLDITEDLLKAYRERSRLLHGYLCPPDRRIQDFLDTYLGDCGEPVPHLPDNTLILDRPGVARVLSLPVNGGEFMGGLVSSYRIRNGVLHNPASDRRTTKG